MERLDQGCLVLRMMAIEKYGGQKALPKNQSTPVTVCAYMAATGAGIDNVTADSPETSYLLKLNQMLPKSSDMALSHSKTVITNIHQCSFSS